MPVEQLERVGDMLTLREASKQLGCSKNALDLAMRRLDIPRVKVGRSVLVRLADIELRYEPRVK